MPLPNIPHVRRLEAERNGDPYGRRFQAREDSGDEEKKQEAEIGSMDDPFADTGRRPLMVGEESDFGMSMTDLSDVEGMRTSADELYNVDDFLQQSLETAGLSPKAQKAKKPQPEPGDEDFSFPKPLETGDEDLFDFGNIDEQLQPEQKKRSRAVTPEKDPF